MHESTINTATAAEARACFTVDPRELNAAVKFLAGKVTERRNTVPILSCVLVEAMPDGTLALTGTDLDLECTVQLAATVETPGQFCTPIDALADALAKVAKNKDCHTVTVEDGDRVTVKGGRARFTLQHQPTDDFPRLACTPIEGTEGGPPLPAFTMPAARFLADCKALAPVICKEEARYYLGGIAVQPRDLGEGEGRRLYLVATDGGNMGVASRALPDGVGEWEGDVLPRKATAVLVAAGKIAGEPAEIAVEIPCALRFAITLGNVRMVAKAVGGTYPDWARVWTGAGPLSPIEAQGLMFPELAPGAPASRMETIGKAAGTIDWREARQGFVGAVADDPDLAFGCLLTRDLASTGRKGFSHHVTGHAEAERFLLELAESQGLPLPGEIEARCAAINDGYGECDLAAMNGKRAFGEARFDGAKLIVKAGRIVGLTISAAHKRNTWFETVTDWETLSERRVQHLGGEELIDGSYSIAMPADGPQLSVSIASYIEGPDGYRYPVATDDVIGGTAIHMSKEQVRALIGESCFETMEFPGANGKPRYICQWLWDDGATRFLIVGKDGRAPKKLDAAREYVTRAEIEAALAGEPVAPIAETAPAAPIAAEAEAEPAFTAEHQAELERLDADYPHLSFVVANCKVNVRWRSNGKMLCATTSISGMRGEFRGQWTKALERAREMAEEYAPVPAPEPVQAKCEPVAATTPAAEPVIALQQAENVPAEPIEPQPLPAEIDVAAILARMDALEARMTALPVESAATPSGGKRERSPAHERAVRSAWAERRARRVLQRELDLAQEALRERSERFTELSDVAVKRMHAHERSERHRRRNALLARQRGQAMVAAVNHMHDRVDAATQRASVAEAELSRLRADMADPSQPERASDIKRLLEERDQARTALSAVTGRAERAEAARDQLADAMDKLVSRVSSAEAAVRAIEARAA